MKLFLEKLYYLTQYLWLSGVLVILVCTIIALFDPKFQFNPLFDIGPLVMVVGFATNFVAVHLLIAEGDIYKERISLLAAFMVINTPILLVIFAEIAGKWIILNAALLILLGIEHFLIPDWPQRVAKYLKTEARKKDNDTIRSYARNLFNLLFILMLFSFLYSAAILDAERPFQTDISRVFALLTFATAVLVAIFLSGTLRAEGYDYTAIVLSAFYLALTWYDASTFVYIAIAFLAILVLSLIGFAHPNWLYNLISEKK